jgi:hypothetical protein
VTIGNTQQQTRDFFSMKLDDRQITIGDTKIVYYFLRQPRYAKNAETTCTEEMAELGYPICGPTYAKSKLISLSGAFWPATSLAT